MIQAMAEYHKLCKVMHLLCRVCGYKIVAKYFLHEVSHFEGCLKLLHMQVSLNQVFKMFYQNFYGADQRQISPSVMN